MQHCVASAAAGRLLTLGFCSSLLFTFNDIFTVYAAANWALLVAQVYNVTFQSKIYQDTTRNNTIACCLDHWKDQIREFFFSCVCLIQHISEIDDFPL